MFYGSHGRRLPAGIFGTQARYAHAGGFGVQGFSKRIGAIWFAVVLVTGATAACSGGSVNPTPGLWVGDHISFTFDGQALSGISIRKVSCNGDGGCYEAADGAYYHLNIPVTDDVFGFSAETSDGGTVIIDGGFDSLTYASGSYRFQSECCSVQLGEWHASLDEPLAKPDVTIPDVVLPDDLTEPPDTVIPGDATEGQIRAIEKMNELRGDLGLGPVAGSEPINNACQSHAQYYLYHCAKYEEALLSPHSENPEWVEGFTGVNFANRMNHFGYLGTPGWEVMAFVGNPDTAIDSWMKTLYHRIPFVHPATAEAGYGVITPGCQWWAAGVDVMNFGRGPDSTDEPVRYPWPDQTGVPMSWDGMESPQPPLPDGASFPTGPVITLTFPAGAFHVASHRLLAPDGGDVAHQYVDPGNDPAGFLSQTVAIYALDPLQGGATYTVELQGNFKDAESTWEWQFTTGP